LLRIPRVLRERVPRRRHTAPPAPAGNALDVGELAVEWLYLREKLEHAGPPRSVRERIHERDELGFVGEAARHVFSVPVGIEERRRETDRTPPAALGGDNW